MADPLDPEQTQEDIVPETAPVQPVIEPAPVQPVTQSASNLDEFLNGTPEEQQAAQKARENLDAFLNGTPEEQNAINSRLAVAQQVIDAANDPMATDLLTSLSRKITEPGKSEAAWADYQKNMLSYGDDIETQFKESSEKNDWKGMASAGIRMIGKDWGDYFAAALGMTNEERQKTQQSFGARMIVGKITDPKEAAETMILTDKYKEDLKSGKSLAPEGQTSAMSFGTGQLSLKLGMNLAQADEYLKTLQDTKTQAFGQGALRNFAIQSGDAFIPFVSVGDIIIDEKNKDQVARRAALAEAINQTISKDYFYGTVSGQALGSLGSFMTAGVGATALLGESANMAGKVLKVPTKLSQAAMYGVMGTSQSVKTDERNLDPLERLASVVSESFVLGLSERGGDAIGNQIDYGVANLLKTQAMARLAPEIAPVVGGVGKALSIMIGESASDQLDAAARGRNPFEDLALSYGTNFGIGAGLALAGLPRTFRRAQVMAQADDSMAADFTKGLSAIRGDTNKTDEQKLAEVETIKSAFGNNERVNTLIDRAWALSAVDENTAPETHQVLKESVDVAKRGIVETILDTGLNKQSQQEKTQEIGQTTGELLPGVPMGEDQEQAELEKMKNHFLAGNKEIRIENTIENAEKIKWLESKGFIYGNLAENGSAYVVRGVRMGQGDLAKWFGEDDPRERFQGEKDDFDKAITKAHTGTSQELDAKVEEIQNASNYDDLRRIGNKYLGVPLTERILEGKLIETQDLIAEENAINARLKVLNSNLAAIRKQREQSPEDEQAPLDETIAKFEQEIEKLTTGKKAQGEGNIVRIVKDMEDQVDEEINSGKIAPEVLANPEVIIAILNPKNASFREHQLSEPSDIEEDPTKLGEAFDLEDARVVENLKRIGAIDDQGRPLMTPAGAIVAYALDKRNYLTSKSLSGYQSYGIADQVYNATVNKALLEIRKGNKIALSTIFNSNLIDFIRKAKVRMRSGVGLGAMTQLKEQVKKADPDKLIEDLGLDENQAQLVKDTFDEISATDAEWQATQPGAIATPSVSERVEATAIIANEIAPLFRQSLKSDLERLAFDSLVDSKVMAKLDSLARQLGSNVNEIKAIQENIQKQLVEQIKTEYRARLTADNLPSLPAPEGDVRKAGNLTNDQLKPTENFFKRAKEETLMTDEELKDFEEQMAVIRSGRRVEDLRNFQQELIALIDSKLGIEDGVFSADVLNDWVELLGGVEGNPDMPGQLNISLAKGVITQADYDTLLKQLNASMDKAVNLISNAKDIKDVRAAAREARASFVRINNAILPKENKPNAKPIAKQTGISTTSGSDKTKPVSKEQQKTAKPGESKQPAKPGKTKGSTSVAGGVSRVLQRIGAAILPKTFSTPKGQGSVPYSEDVIVSLGGKFTDPENFSPEQRQDASAAISSMEGSKNKSFYLANGAGTGKTRILLAVAQHYLNKGKKVLYLTAHDAVTPDWKNRTIGGTIQQDSALLGVPIVAYGGKASGLNELTSIPSGTVVVSTYNDRYMTKLLELVDNDTVVIFDEHHSGRNIFQAEQEGNAATKWPVLMDNIAKKAGAVMMASGTPFDKPDQLLSLARLGIFDNISQEQLLFNLGFQKYELSTSNKYYWDLAPGVTLDEMQDRMEKYFDKLALNGVFRSRSLKLDGVNVEFKNVPLDAGIRATLDSIAERFGGSESMASRMAAVVAQKRALETYKVKAAAQQAYDAIKRGVKPIVYVGFVSKEDSRGNKVDQVSKQVEEELKKIIAQDNPELAARLNVARLFSGGDGKQLAMDKFNNQGADVLIATVQMGGTGIELDDKGGDQPREMIIMSPPISAISAVQLIYRVWRADTASRPNIVFMTAEHQVDQEPLEKMRQRMRLLDATMGAGFQALKGEKVKEEIQIPVKGSPENIKFVNDKMTSIFKSDFKDGVVTIKDPSGKTVMTYKFNLYSGFDAPARADFGQVDEEDTITLNPDRMAAAAKVLGDRYDAWLQAVVLEEALHLETVRMWRSQGKDVSAELRKVARGMSGETRKARARLYYATQGYDLNKPDVKAKIDALAADDQLIAFEALRQNAQLALYGVISEQLAVVSKIDIARVQALADEALRSEVDDEDKTMFSTILSYINNMIAVLKRGFGAPQAMARLSMREALQEAATRLTKTKSEYTELADTTEPEAAPFQGSPAQPISLGVFGSYDLRVNKLIEDHLDNLADNVFGLKAANDSGRTVDKQDWLFAIEQAYKNGTITKFERNMYRAAGLDSSINNRVSLTMVPVKALEIGEAMETGTFEGSKSAVAIPTEALTPFATVENAPVTDSKIQGKELYRFTLRGYPPQKTQSDSIDQGLSQGVAKLLSTREKVVYEGQDYTWNRRGALVRELQRRGANNYVSRVLPSRPVSPYAAQPALSTSTLLSSEGKGQLAYHGTSLDQISSILGGIRPTTNFSPNFNGQAFGGEVVLVYPANQLALEKKSYQDDLVLREQSSAQPVAAMLDAANFADAESARSYDEVYSDIANLPKEDADIVMDLYSALDLGDRKNVAKIRNDIRGNPAAVAQQIKDMRIREFNGKSYLPSGEQVFSLPKAKANPNAETINRLAVELSKAQDETTPAISQEQAIKNAASVIPNNLPVFTYELSDSGRVTNVKQIREGQPTVFAPFASEVAIADSGSTAEPTKNGMDIKLGVNMKQIIKLLGPAMYSKPILDTAVKELIQNSFDAVRSAGFTNENPGEIDIYIDAQNRQLTVTDNGIGMTPEIIQKAFFTIGGTHKEGSPENTSGGLGLAKMAFILGSEDISITTVKDGVESTLKATSQEVQDGIIKVKTKKTKAKNGTSVTVTIPKTITDANGDKKEQKFSSFQPFLKMPLFGPVVVTSKVIFGEKEILDMGVNQKDYQFETAFKFDWGTINMYIDPKLSTYPSIHVLSAGLFQFDIPTFEIFGFGDAARSLPYNVVFDVRPSVRADNAAYPFNLQREGWRGTVSEDIKAMYGYIKQFATQQSLLQAKEAMQGIEKLPSIDITQDIPQEELAKIADERTRTRQIRPTSAPNKVVAVDFSTALDALKKIKLIYEDSRIVEQDRSKYVEKSFRPEKAIEMPTMDVSGFDVNEPLYVNNTNYQATDLDKAFFTELSNTFLYLMRDLGTKIAEEDPSDKLAQLADKTPTGWFAGVSLDKNYRGLNMIKPFQSIWLNPASLSQIALKFPSSAAAETLHIMLHEITHVDQRNEGAGFTSALATLDAKLDAYNVDIALIELKLKKIYEKYWTTIQNLNNQFGSFNTKNRAESFKSSAALGVEQARAERASQGIPNVDATGAVSIQGQGPSRNFGTQESDSGIGLGDTLNAKLKNGEFKFPQTPLAPQASGPRIVESQAMKNLLGTFSDNLPDVPFKQRLMEDLYNNSVTMEQQFEDARNYIEGQDSFSEAVRHYLSNSIDTPLPIQAAVGFELLRVLSPQAKTDRYAREVMTQVMLVQKQRYGTDPGRTVQLWAALSEMSDNPEAMKMYVHEELASIAAGRLEPYKRDLDEARIGLQEAGRKAADRVATDPTLKSTIDKIAQLIDKNRKEQNFEGIDKAMYGFVISNEAQELGDAFLGPIASKPQASDVPGFDADEIRLAPERIKNLGTLISRIINSSDNPDALQADVEKLRSLVYLTPSLRNNPNQAEVRRLVELYFDAAFSYSKALRESASRGTPIAPVSSVTKGEATKQAELDRVTAEDAAPVILNTDFGDQLLMYADAAATLFERKSKKLNEEPKKKEFMEEFAKMIRMDLEKQIREKGGLKSKFEKPVPRTPAQNMLLAVRNIDEVRMYIAEIRDILLERYKGKEAELVGLEPLIDDALDHPLSVSAVAKTIKSLQSIGGPKVNVRELIRSSRGDIEAFENKLSELLTQNSNLDAAQIKVVNDYLRDAMAKFVAEERKKELERIKKRIEEKRGGKKAKRQVTSALTRMLEAGNLGVLKDQELFDSMRVQLGLPEMTPEQLAYLDKMIEDLPNWPKGRVRNQKISKMYEYVKLLSPMTITELLVNYQTMNLLLGIGTIGINASSSFANNIAQSAIIAARGATKVVTGTIFNKPTETIRGIGYLKAAIETYKPFTSWKKGIGLQAAKEIFLKGDFSSVQSVTTMEMGGVNMFEAFSNQLDAYLKKSSGAMKPEITIKTPGWLEWIGLNPEYTFSLANKYAWSKYNPATVGPFIIFGRAMAIGDAMNTIAAKKMYLTAEAYNVALKKGLTSRIEVEQEVARMLGNTPENRARAEAIATAESKEFNYTPYQYALRVEEIMEQNRPQDEITQDLIKRAEKFAERSNFRNNFEGVLGAAAASAVTLSNVFPPSKFVLKYLRTGAALGNAALDVVPVLGTLRYYNGIGNFNKMRDSKFFSPPPQKDTVEQDIALGKLWLSYILGAGLLALLRKALDREPDPDFNIHISGPKDPAQRKALLAAGWKARSIQIGSFADGNPRFISFEALPPFLAGMLIPVGAFTEAIRYEKRSKQEALVPTIAAASWMTIYAMLDYSFLSGIRGLIQLAAPSNGATTSTGQLENIIKFTGNVASTLLPGYAILRDVEKMVEGIYGLPTGRLYQDSYLSVFLASVPFASKVGEPALDFLGGTTRAKFWNSVPFVRRIMTTGADTSEYAQGIRTEDAIHDKLISLFAKNQTSLDWEAGPLKIFAAAELATKPTIGISEILTLKRELTDNEKYDWLKKAYPYLIESLGGNIEVLESLEPEEFKYVVGQLARPFMKLALYEVLGEENQGGIINELSPEATNVLPPETK